MPHIYKDILLGVAVGDALGVPVEFMSREEIAQNPVRDMTGFGTYNLPPGSFSDDSSLTFCLAESLAAGFSTETLAAHFINWYYSNYWTPHGYVFDIGISVPLLPVFITWDLPGCWRKETLNIIFRLS